LRPLHAVLSICTAARTQSEQKHVTMLFLLATSLATLELTTDNWDKEVANSGKSAMIK